jgi:hypothetical protein
MGILEPPGQAIRREGCQRFVEGERTECPGGTHGEVAPRDVLSWSTILQGGCLDGQHQSRSHSCDSSHQSGAGEERALGSQTLLLQPSSAAGGSPHPWGL